MIVESNYSLKYQKETLKQGFNKFGDLVSSEYTKKQIKEHKLVKTSGMTLMKKKDIFEILEEVVKSNTDIKIISYMIRKQGLGGFVVDGESKPIGINELADMFGVTRRKISSIINSMIEKDFIKKNKRKIQINPYFAIPNNSSKENSFLLQLEWKHNFEKTKEELLEIYSRDLQEVEYSECNQLNKPGTGQ